MPRRWSTPGYGYALLVRANGRHALVQTTKIDWREVRGEGPDPAQWVGPILLNLHLPGVTVSEMDVDVYVQDGATGEQLLTRFTEPGGLVPGTAFREVGEYVVDEWAKLVEKRIENACRA